MITLPDGWATCALGDLAEYVTSGSRDWSKYYSTAGALFVRTQDINTNRLGSLNAIARVSLPERAEGKRTRILRDDLLITITGANVGKCAHVEVEIPEAYVSQSVALVRLRDKSLARIIHRQLISPAGCDGRTVLQQSAYGLGRPVLNLDNVRNVLLRLPPRQEQERIADKLDALLERVDACRERLDRVPEILKRFRQSVFAAAVSGRLTEEWRTNRDNGVPSAEFSGWRYGSFIEFFDIQGGTQPPKSTFISEPREGYVRLLQIRDFGDRPVPTFIPDRTSLKKCEPEDVLLGRYGASVGRVCTGLAGAYNVALAKVVPRSEYARGFVEVLVSAPDFYVAINGFQRSAQDGFNKNDLQQIDVSIPPIDEQSEIVRRVESIFAYANRLEGRCDDARGSVDHLTPALLAKAFHGKLVAQDLVIADYQDTHRFLDERSPAGPGHSGSVADGFD